MRPVLRVVPRREKRVPSARMAQSPTRLAMIAMEIARASPLPRGRAAKAARIVPSARTPIAPWAVAPVLIMPMESLLAAALRAEMAASPLQVDAKVGHRMAVPLRARAQANPAVRVLQAAVQAVQVVAGQVAVVPLAAHAMVS